MKTEQISHTTETISDADYKETLEAFKRELVDYARGQLALRAKLGNGIVTVHELVDTDAADNRAYIKTHETSEVFCVPMSDVEIVAA